ncbi:hypothetical protein Tco_0566388 [Tanacetum coccineum]
MTISELKVKLISVEKGKNVDTKFDRFSFLRKLICVRPMNKNKDLKSKIVPKIEVRKDLSKPVTSCSLLKIEQVKSNTNVIARGMYRVVKTGTQILIAKPNMLSSNYTRVESSSSISRPESKSTNLKKSVFLNTKSKSTSKEFKKHQNSGSFVSNKSDASNSNVSTSKANVLNAKVVNAVNNGSNVVCVSCGKNVFMISHDKCVARYALSMNSKVKRALFTSHVAAKSSSLGATPIVMKSRNKLDVAEKVIQLVLWIVDSGCSKHMTGNLKLLRNFVDKFIGTIRFKNDHLQQSHDTEIMFRETSRYITSTMLRALDTTFSCKKDLVDGLLKFKYDKDHLCPTCEQGKSKKAILKPKLVPSTHSKLEMIHMDLCGPIRVESINGKRNDHQVYYSDSVEYTSLNSEDNEAPQIVSSSKEPIVDEPTTPISDDITDKSIQEDTVEFDGNTFINPFCSHVLEEVESSSTNQDPSNMHEFYQQHRSTDQCTSMSTTKAEYISLSACYATRFQWFPPANTTHDLVTNPQQSSIKEKAKKLIGKGKANKKTSISSSKTSDRNEEAAAYTCAYNHCQVYQALSQQHYARGWFTKKSGSTKATKRKTNWFDMILKFNIDQNVDCILGHLTFAVAKKIKEIIKKDELTIADLEGVGLEMLKRQYKNDVELEYHVSHEVNAKVNVKKKRGYSFLMLIVVRRSDNREYEFRNLGLHDLFTGVMVGKNKGRIQSKAQVKKVTTVKTEGGY